MESLSLYPLRLSLQVAGVSTLFIVLIGLPMAYILARKKFRGRDILDIIFTLPLVLPPTVTGYYLVALLGRRGLIGEYLYESTGFTVMFTWYAAVLASFVVALPLMIKTSRAAFESVDGNLINASYTLGHSEFETALRVTLPMAKKGILAGGVLSFARALGEFGATLMLAGNIPGRTETMPLAIYTLAGSGDWNQATVMVILLTLVSGITLYFANRFGRKAIW